MAAGPDPVPTIAVAAIHDPMVVPKSAELQETEPPYPERSDSFNLNNSTSDGWSTSLNFTNNFFREVGQGSTVSFKPCEAPPTGNRVSFAFF